MQATAATSDNSKVIQILSDFIGSDPLIQGIFSSLSDTCQGSRRQLSNRDALSQMLAANSRNCSRAAAQSSSHFARNAMIRESTGPASELTPYQSWARSPEVIVRDPIL